jgi:hypothetical protein
VLSTLDAQDETLAAGMRVAPSQGAHLAALDLDDAFAEGRSSRQAMRGE